MGISVPHAGQLNNRPTSECTILLVNLIIRRLDRSNGVEEKKELKEILERTSRRLDEA